MIQILADSGSTITIFGIAVPFIVVYGLIKLISFYAASPEEKRERQRQEQQEQLHRQIEMQEWKNPLFVGKVLIVLSMIGLTLIGAIWLLCNYMFDVSPLREVPSLPFGIIILFVMLIVGAFVYQKGKRRRVNDRNIKQ